MTDRVICLYCGSPWAEGKFHPGRCHECGAPHMDKPVGPFVACVFGLPLHEGGFELLEERYGKLTLDKLFELCGMWGSYLDVRVIPVLIQMIQSRYAA